MVETATGAYVITRRRNKNRGRLEAGVLQDLARQSLPLPALIASDGLWLVQEYLAGERLSQALDAASAPRQLSLLTSAINSLAVIHGAARRCSLAERVTSIGAGDDWLATLIDMPRRFGAHLDIAPAPLDIPALHQSLRVTATDFVKWDARPGNAIVDEQRNIAWFDWEHCGRRHGMDDLVWLLGDEWIPDNAAMEASLLERVLDDFRHDKSRAEAEDYFTTFGTFHTCVRLSLVVSRKADGDWWDRQKCLRGDKIGITAEETDTLCRRGARWAERCPLTRPLGGWFRDVADRLIG